MECVHCGFEVADATVCFICGKPPLKRNKVKCSVEIITNPQTREGKKFAKMCREAARKYSCPFCGERLVKEVIIHDNGYDEIVYDMNRKEVTGLDVWGEPNPRIEGTYCFVCGFSLPSADQEMFFEESERWLPQ